MIGAIPLAPVGPVSDDEWAAQVEAWRIERETRARRTAHRNVPIGDGNGFCRWCGTMLPDKHGKPDPRRSWCREKGGGSPCLREWNLHRDSATQFAWLEANRGLRCAWCRVDNPLRWRGIGTTVVKESAPPPMPWDGERKGRDYIDALLAFYERRRLEYPFWGHATLIEQVSALEVDHVIPLWLVAIEIPPDERRHFFGPDNLQLLCGACHKIKTKREAGERAALKAFTKAQLPLPL